MTGMSGKGAAADPEGYYRALGVPPTADHAAIVLAYRSRAKILHPDVPGTGDAGRFMEMQAAYEVIGSRKNREAYDRAALAAALEAERPRAAPFRAYPPSPPHGRFDPDAEDDFPSAQARARPGGKAGWLGAAALAVSAAIVIGIVQIVDEGEPRRVAAALPGAPAFAPAVPEADPGPSAAPAIPAGPSTDYVSPSAATDDATLWRYDPARRGFAPTGRIPPFAPVQLLRPVPSSAMAEIRLASGQVAFIEATRLAPGDAAAARRADCTFNAGRPPENGEVLRRGARGPFALQVENRRDLPAVVQLRDESGHLAVEAFVAAHNAATIPALPGGLYALDAASGEFWSRRCSVFTAAMRAQRQPGQVRVGAASPPVVVSAVAEGVDIADAVFRRD